jgi:hypothetical protein
LPSYGWANRCVSIYTWVIQEEERGKRFKRLHIGARYVCGLDMHKKYTYATILGPDGDILAQKKMGNEEVPDTRELIEPV